MADKAPVAKKKKAPQYATVAQFNSLAESVGSLVELIKSGALATAPAAAISATETPVEREVRKAAPDVNPVNPAWEEKAREIVGDALDHCEVLYPKQGGVIFTLVIKQEFSNAPTEYLERHKVDRRSREIGNEGIEGVEQWCKLVKSNLNRPSNK